MRYYTLECTYCGFSYEATSNSEDVFSTTCVVCGLAMNREEKRRSSKEDWPSNIKALAEEYCIVEDEYDYYYVVECCSCGHILCSSCLMGPEAAIADPCYVCGGKRKHKAKQEPDTMDEEAWNELYKND